MKEDDGSDQKFAPNHTRQLCRPLFKSENKKVNFLISQQNICCGHSKELSQLDGSFELPKHMLKLIGKKIFTILC